MFIFNFSSRPGHNSEIKTNYKSAYVSALEPMMASLGEASAASVAGGDASSSSTVAATVSIGVIKKAVVEWCIF